MAKPRPPEKAYFLVAVLAAGREELALAAEALTAEFGPAFMGARPLAFRRTDYYRAELGDAPLRSFLAFPGFFRPGELAGRKLAANRLEEELAKRIGGASPRPVNLDPGFLTSSKLVLASAKDFSHRIYLSGGIYAEVTLQFRGGRFDALPWTFPDYASGDYDPFFLALRKALRDEIEKTGGERWTHGL